MRGGIFIVMLVDMGTGMDRRIGLGEVAKARDALFTIDGTKDLIPVTMLIGYPF